MCSGVTTAIPITWDSCKERFIQSATCHVSAACQAVCKMPQRINSTIFPTSCILSAHTWREEREYCTVGAVRQTGQTEPEGDSTVRADSKTSLAFRVNGGVCAFEGLSRLSPETLCTVVRARSIATGPNRPFIALLSFSFAINPRIRCSVPTSAQTHALYRAGPGAPAGKQWWRETDL